MDVCYVYDFLTEKTVVIEGFKFKKCFHFEKYSHDWFEKNLELKLTLKAYVT